MNIIDIIDKKVHKKELSYDEIEFLINNYSDRNITDVQLGSFLMATFINGMTDDETINFTDAILKNSDILNLNSIEGLIVDIASTGCVGDKISLILSPLLASFDINVAHLTNRGFNYIGGTAEKLSSIENFNTTLNTEDFVNQVRNIKIAISTPYLVQINDEITSLRKSNGTYDFIPFIAASIMTQKLSLKSDLILIDIKIGSGSYIKTEEEGRRLGKLLVKIGKKYRRLVICFLIRADEPLGHSIGNALEIKEVIDTLSGNGPEDLIEIVVSETALVLSSMKKINMEDARNIVFKQINNGEAFNKFKELIEYQGGNIENICISDKVFSIKSDKSGYINSIDAEGLGLIVKEIGGGRLTDDDEVNTDVGIVLKKKIGDYVEKDEDIACVYLKDKDISIAQILKCFKLSDTVKENEKLIIDIIK